MMLRLETSVFMFFDIRRCLTLMFLIVVLLLEECDPYVDGCCTIMRLWTLVLCSRIYDVSEFGALCVFDTSFGS